MRPHLTTPDDATARGLAAAWRALQPPLDPADRWAGTRAALAWGWRLYAVVALFLVVPSLDRMLGPTSEPAFARFHAADFGGFYTGATIVWRGDIADLGELDTQRRVQAEIQLREQSGWRWFNPLPHPPVLSLFTSPMAQLPMRTAYWLWVLGSLVAAGLGAALLARALCPRVWIATTVILLTFEPLWHLVWWGQVDAFLFLPFAAGCALLLRARSPRDDLLAGALMASLALIPQYAIVPFLALAWARRWAAAGMAAGGGALALASVALVGGEGLEHYRDMVEYFGAFTGTATVTEWAMFNVRGVVMRQGGEWGLGHDTMLALVWALSLPLAALSVVAAGRALRPTRSPDLALSVVVLAALLTSYHTHRQTLVFFFVALAAFVGRSLRPGTPPWLALVWAAPVVAMHAVISQLHFNHPITFYPVQRYLTPPSIAVLLLLAAALLVPPVARRLDRAWSETGEADVAGAVPDAAPAGLAGGRSGAVAAGEA